MSGDVRVPNSIETILDEIEARANAATDGASLTRYNWGGGRLACYCETTDSRQLVADFYTAADREFYTSARTDVPILVAALRGALALISAAKEEAALKDQEIGDLSRKVKDLEFTRDTLMDTLRALHSTPAQEVLD